MFVVLETERKTNAVFSDLLLRKGLEPHRNSEARQPLPFKLRSRLSVCSTLGAVTAFILFSRAPAITGGDHHPSPPPPPTHIPWCLSDSRDKNSACLLGLPFPAPLSLSPSDAGLAPVGVNAEHPPPLLHHHPSTTSGNDEKVPLKKQNTVAYWQKAGSVCVRSKEGRKKIKFPWSSNSLNSQCHF